MDITKLFDEAILAQAAYANLSAILTQEQLITELKKEGGVTQAQAEYFAEHYVVVEQSENIHTGFSATLFKNIKNQEYHLANRGSASPSFTDPDWIDANFDNFKYGMAYDQVADLINFYLRLTSQVADPGTIKEIQQFISKEVTLESDDPLRKAA